MAISRRIVAWSAVAVFAGIIVLFALPSYRQGEASIAGTRAEDFSLQLAGKTTQLSSLQGKVVVLNFWASWCPPCIEETPALNQLQQRIAGRGGIVLGVSIDEDPRAYDKFLKDQGIVFPTWRAPSTKIMHDYGTTLIPDTYVIDRQGRIARKFVSSQKWDSPEMSAYFDQILGKS